MTTNTISFDWAQPDEREQGREDSCWYTFTGSAHDIVTHVSRGERVIDIYVDGEMRIGAFRKEGDDFVHQGTVRYCDDLSDYGIERDDDLWGLPDAPRADEYYLQGPNKAGYYFLIDHNSWYDLYTEDGEHLDCVRDTLTSAIETAVEIINDDTDEVWANLSE
ncbi:MAG: hypothetical protein ACO395_10435 [Pontimonas sp.]